MSIQLILWHSFTTVELIDTGSNFCVNRVAVLQEPVILFFLGLQQTKQDFLDTAGTGCLEQLLDSGLKISVMDFDVRNLILRVLSNPFLS